MNALDRQIGLVTAAREASGRDQAAADSAESATPRAGSLTAGPDELASSVIQKLAANETIRCRTR